MAHVKGISRSGRYEVTGHCSIFWALLPILTLLIRQPVTISWELVVLIIMGLLLGATLDFLVAFIFFAIGSNK